MVVDNTTINVQNATIETVEGYPFLRHHKTIKETNKYKEITCCGQSRKEATMPIALLSTMTLFNIGTWNVRTVDETWKGAYVAEQWLQPGHPMDQINQNNCG